MRCGPDRQPKSSTVSVTASGCRLPSASHSHRERSTLPGEGVVYIIRQLCLPGCSGQRLLDPDGFVITGVGRPPPGGVDHEGHIHQADKRGTRFPRRCL